MSKKGTKTIETKLGSINHPKNGFEISERQYVDIKTTNTKPKHTTTAKLYTRIHAHTHT